MKHIFVVNPIAGAVDHTQIIKEFLKNHPQLDSILYNTTGPGDATKYVKEMITKFSDIRFYACGGDGTLNEVINGVEETGIQVASYPCGTGNDFVKVFSDYDFTDLEQLVEGEPKKIDLLKVNDKYCINICNCGFDAAVAYHMNDYKAKTKNNPKKAYIKSLKYCLFHEMRHEAIVYLDDKVLSDKGLLLVGTCNGVCCGGQFYMGTDAKVDDGILDVVVAKKMSIFKFLTIVKPFAKGGFLENKKVMSAIMYKKGHKVKIVAPKGIIYGMDGETYSGTEINIDVIHNALTLVLPISKNK